MPEGSSGEGDVGFDPCELDLSDVDTSKKVPASERELRALENSFGYIADKMGPELYREMARIIHDGEAKT